MLLDRERPNDAAGGDRAIHPVGAGFPGDRGRCWKRGPVAASDECLERVYQRARHPRERFSLRQPSGRTGASMTIQTNADRLITQTLAGEVWPPLADRHGYRVDADGVPFILSLIHISEPTRRT